MHGGRRFFQAVRNREDAGEHAGKPDSEKNSARSQKETDWHKIIWEQYFPVAFSIGISLEEFKHLNPTKLSYCLKGHQIKRKMRDEEMWMWCGKYMLSAVKVAVEYNLAGKNAKSEYIKEPLLHDLEDHESTEDEIQKKREEFVMRMRTMKANWDLTHPKKS